MCIDLYQNRCLVSGKPCTVLKNNDPYACQFRVKLNLVCPLCACTLKKEINLYRDNDGKIICPQCDHYYKRKYLLYDYVLVARGLEEVRVQTAKKADAQKLAELIKVLKKMADIVYLFPDKIYAPSLA